MVPSGPLSMDTTDSNFAGILRGVENCRIPSGCWLGTQQSMWALFLRHQHSFSKRCRDVSGICSMTYKLYDVVCALVTHC